MTPDCRPYAEDLKAYADGELPLARRLAVRRHLFRCAACRKDLNAMQQLADDLRATEGADALAPDLRAKILAAPSAPDPGEAGDEPHSSPVPTVPGARGRSLRPAFAWVAGLAVLAWLGGHLLSPSVQRDYSMGANPGPVAASQVARMAAPLTPRGQAEMNVAAAPPALATRQVHKEASIGVEVDDVQGKSDQVTQIVKSAGGFVASDTLSTGDGGGQSADLTVKVPVMQFETVLGQVARLGRVQSKNITGEDVTEKTSDADQAEAVLEDEARRADARLASLGKKAGWRDQQADKQARVELAQARGRLMLLHQMAALSTLSVSLTEKPKPAAVVPAPGPLSGLGDTTRAATGSLLASTGTLLALVIWVLAYAPIWLPLALIGRVLYRRYGRTAV